MSRDEKRELIARLRDEVSRRVNRKHFSLSDAEMVAACTAGADALQREIDGRPLPLGWVAVPMEPTIEMLKAAFNSCEGGARPPSDRTAAKRYRAMIAAAPKLAGENTDA